MQPIGRTRQGLPTLRVHIQPRATKNRFCGLHGSAVKLAVTAPPVDGKANKELGRYLARTFAVRPKTIRLLSGSHSRDKLFCFTSLSENELHERLQRLLTP